MSGTPTNAISVQRQSIVIATPKSETSAIISRPVPVIRMLQTLLTEATSPSIRCIR